jgi:hypothetical protein
MHFLAAHHFRRFYGRRHRTEGGFDVYNDPFPQACRRTCSHTGYFEGSMLITFADDGAYLGRADIKADN